MLLAACTSFKDEKAEICSTYHFYSFLALNAKLTLYHPYSFVKHSMKEAREGHTDGVKQLAGEITNIEKALTTLEKQGEDAQSNLVDFLKTNNIPFQMR